MSKKKIYGYRNDIHIEQSFYERMVDKLDGIRMKEKFNHKDCFEVTCPICSKRTAKMGYSSRGNTFMFVCRPSDGCSKGMNLHQLIQNYGSNDLIKEWNESREITWNQKNGWNPIKNKRTPGPKKNKIKERISISDLHGDWTKIKFDQRKSEKPNGS